MTRKMKLWMVALSGCVVLAVIGGGTPSVTIVKMGRIGVLAFKLGKSADSCDGEGRCPLMIAAARSDIEMISTLARKGASVNRKDSSGRTALHYAMFGNSPEAVRILLRSGADPNIRDARGYSPLMYATMPHHCGACAEPLILSDADLRAREPGGFSVLMGAISENEMPLVRMLLARGIDADEADDNGTTPLMLSARLGRLEAAKALVSSGASVHLRDITGKDALQYARESTVISADEKLAIVDLLSKHK